MKKQILIVGILTAILITTAIATPEGWLENFDTALATAKKEKKLVLANFTGSDWCPWCKVLANEVFSKQEFKDYAKTNLVLVEIDFPKNKSQSDETKKNNRALLEKYKVDGFPTLIIFNAEGKELDRFVGYQQGGPKAYIEKIEKLKKESK